ncbi:hypothetical protein CDD83_616 [Cordyceps sp. RAO-2017]|nr:hypothetical protein CDD83_616 [Cordyceps sp. RAO-2017]
MMTDETGSVEIEPSRSSGLQASRPRPFSHPHPAEKHAFPVNDESVDSQQRPCDDSVGPRNLAEGTAWCLLRCWWWLECTTASVRMFVRSALPVEPGAEDETSLLSDMTGASELMGNGGSQALNLESQL